MHAANCRISLTDTCVRSLLLTIHSSPHDSMCQSLKQVRRLCLHGGGTHRCFDVHKAAGLQTLWPCTMWEQGFAGPQELEELEEKWPHDAAQKPRLLLDMPPVMSEDTNATNHAVIP